jgi:hypothetical protein
MYDCSDGMAGMCFGLFGLPAAQQHQQLVRSSGVKQARPGGIKVAVERR